MDAALTTPLPPLAPPAVLPDTHQLDKLPDLPAARSPSMEPVVWVIILFFVSCAGVLCVCGIYHLDSAVQSAFVAANATLHTTAAAGLKADDIGRKIIYGIAANKDGIKTDQS
jgi:hypothetical protein